MNVSVTSAFSSPSSSSSRFSHEFRMIISDFVKLLMLGKKLNFLNIMFINIFFYESVVGCVMIPNFFSIGKKNLIGTDLSLLALT